jgi:cytochrome b pre-mRNA-processing protein 3
MFQRPGLKEDTRASILGLYGAIVAQAREPLFYSAYGVPDTIEGRFDMVVLHVYLVSRRLMRAGEPARAAAQELFDLFFRDMDESIRELGVGDLTVPKKVRAMGEAFYGRAGAYDTALADGDDIRLTAALRRNVFAGGAGAENAAAHLAGYVRAAIGKLDAQDAGRIARGEAVFPKPQEFET